MDRIAGLLAALGSPGEHEANLLLAAKPDRVARTSVSVATVGRIVERERAIVRAANGIALSDTPDGW